MRMLVLTAMVVALSAPAIAEPSLKNADTGLYKIEQSHAFLTWTVRHNGISDYTVNFTEFDAVLDFNPDDPEASSIQVTINPGALWTRHPDPDKKAAWEEELGHDKKFLNAGEFPAITFTSTAATLSGDFTGTVTGDLTFLGITRPVTLDVTYNGVTNVPWFGQRDLIGFNAVATIKRSDWGMTAMKRVVSDQVTITFSGEFLQEK